MYSLLYTKAVVDLRDKGLKNESILWKTHTRICIKTIIGYYARKFIIYKPSADMLTIPPKPQIVRTVAL